MIYVTDTMAIVSYLSKRKLPPSVKQIFLSADLGLDEIRIPAIVLAEIAYLSEKGRIDISLNEVFNHVSFYPSYSEQPLTFDIVFESYKIIDIPELHDRLIAGTAKLLDFSLITNDPIIQASSFVSTIW